MAKGSKASLLIIFVTVFIDLLGFGIVLPLLPIYAEHFRPQPWVLGLLMASFSMMQFLFAPVWGRISDRIGRRPVLIVGLAGSMVFYFLFGYASSLGTERTLLGMGALTWLFITRIGAGIAGATISTAQAYIADVTGPKERARGMALIGAAFGIGFTFGPLLGAAFVSSEVGGPVALAQADVATDFGLSPTQREEVARSLAAYRARIDEFGLAVTQTDRDAARAARDRELLDLLTPDQRDKWNATISRPPSPAPGYLAAILSGLALLSAIMLLPESLHGQATGRAHHWLDLHAFRHAVAQPATGLILLTMFATTFAFAQFEVSLSLLMREHYELSLQDVFYVFAYIGLILTLSQGVLVRRLVPKLGEFVMSITGTMLMTGGLILIGVAALRESLSMLYAVVPVVVVGFSFLTPSLQSLLSRNTSADLQGSILGLGQSVTALARIVGPVAGIVLIKTNIGYPYWVAAAIMAFGAVLCLGLRGRVVDLPPAAEQAPIAPA